MSSIGKILKKYNKKVDALDLELIISRVIKKPREFVLAYQEYKIPKFKIENLKLKIARRMRGEPLAYILGEKEFYGLKFKVNKNVLIPRPETEMIVEYVISNLQFVNLDKKILIIDVGTGSGNIIISLAKELKKSKLPITNYQLLAIDISKKSLQAARQNAKLHKVDKKINPAPLYRKSGMPEEKWCGVKFLYGNLLEPIIKNIKNSKFEIRNSKFIITANLPYLTPAQIKKSPSIQHEPKIALDAGRDGLKYYRELFSQIKKLQLTSYNLQAKFFVLCEIDPAQTSKIRRIIKNNFSGAKITIKKDLRGLDRIFIIKI